MSGQETYRRFGISQRIQHWVMFLSFTALATTGLPQRYAQSAWANALIGIAGGIETVRIIHRGAAIIFILVTLFHFYHLMYGLFVQRVRPAILPGLKDVTDLLDSVRYNVHLTNVHPNLPRYNFVEKIEYWSLIWGSMLMIATGFLLWNPVLATRLLPGEAIPAAKMAHSAEALLAVLAVVIWHFYSVHLKRFNRSIFTGKMSRKEMEEEHGAELEEITSGIVRFPEPRDAVGRRERFFLPAAFASALLLVGVLYWFVTTEQTAIATVPPAETAQAYVPATPTPTNTPTVTATPTNTPVPTPTPTATATESFQAIVPITDTQTLLSLMVIPHPVEGREDCLMCHGEDKLNPYPPDHAGRPSTTCLVCHGTSEAEEHLPARVKHDLEGRQNCLMCHAVDLLPVSHKTAGFSPSDCLLCHVPPGQGAAGVATVTPEPTAGPAPATAAPHGTSEAAGIPHAIAGHEDCLLCHGPQGVRPYPVDHAGRSTQTCTACHSPLAQVGPTAGETPVATDESTVAGSASPIPHDLEGREECLLCHGLGSAESYPADHEGRANSTCVACHKPQ